MEKNSGLKFTEKSLAQQFCDLTLETLNPKKLIDHIVQRVNLKLPLTDSEHIWLNKDPERLKHFVEMTDQHLTSNLSGTDQEILPALRDLILSGPKTYKLHHYVNPKEDIYFVILDDKIVARFTKSELLTHAEFVEIWKKNDEQNSP